MPDIDTRILRSFLTVASNRSFSAAAHHLGCSQGTMSLRIKGLEDQLGMRLFERKRNDVRLTVAGHDLLPGVRAIVDAHDRLIDRASARHIKGSVRLGIAEGYSVHLLPRVLERVQRLYAAIELAVVCADSPALRRMVREDALDLAVAVAPRELPAAALLSRPHLRWVASPDFAPGEWNALPVACFPDGHAFRAAALEALHARGIAYREVVCSANEQVIHCAVAAGAAVAVMAEDMVPDGLRIVSDTRFLPTLGRIGIQLLEAPAPHSDAVRHVKLQIGELHPGA